MINKKLLLALATAAALSAATEAQTIYNGNGGTGFGGPVGQGTLKLSSDGTTLTGTITTGGSSMGNLGDELVIYIDSQPGGFTTTGGFASGGTDVLREAVNGRNNTLQATVNFTSGFAADFAIAISPNQAQFGGLYALDASGAAAFLQSTSLTPTANAGPYTFSISLANIGVAAGGSFKFATTYGNFHSDVFRSNEAFGNTISDVTNPANTGNLGQDTGLLGFNTFVVVPEPSILSLTALGLIGLFTLRRRLT